MNEKKNDCLPCPCGTHSKAACDLAGTCGQRTAATCSAVPNMPELVNRFLGWPLPNAASRRLAPDIDRPIGTHLLDAGEARAMLEYVLATPASSAPSGECKACGGMGFFKCCLVCNGTGAAHPAAAPDSAQQGKTSFRHSEAYVSDLENSLKQIADALGVTGGADDLIAAVKMRTQQGEDEPRSYGG